MTLQALRPAVLEGHFRTILGLNFWPLKCTMKTSNRHDPDEGAPVRGPGQSPITRRSPATLLTPAFKALYKDRTETLFHFFIFQLFFF